MKVFFDAAQREHDPQHFVLRGVTGTNLDAPGRIDALLAGAERGGHAVVAPDVDDADVSAALARVHTPEYLHFLRHAHEEWRTLPGAAAEVIANVHPNPGLPAAYPVSVIGRAGYHMADTACPIGPRTWAAAHAAAATALAAARTTLSTGEPTYALARPPGHHATAVQAGGSCFLNNAAVAATACRMAGRRPAIVDVDLHHGNGTQAIFYRRDDVLTVSIHADPAHFYPFFHGHAHERGAGAGEGFNLNLPLPLGSGDEAFLDALDVARERVDAFGADVLVVALGLDAHEADPYAGLAVSTEGFERIGGALTAFGLPEILVQEGGYLSPALSDNLAAVLAAFREARP